MQLLILWKKKLDIYNFFKNIDWEIFRANKCKNVKIWILLMINFFII